MVGLGGAEPERKREAGALSRGTRRTGRREKRGTRGTRNERAPAKTARRGERRREPPPPPPLPTHRQTLAALPTSERSNQPKQPAGVGRGAALPSSQPRQSRRRRVHLTNSRPGRVLLRILFLLSSFTRSTGLTSYRAI